MHTKNRRNFALILRRCAIPFLGRVYTWIRANLCPRLLPFTLILGGHDSHSCNPCSITHASSSGEFLLTRSVHSSYLSLPPRSSCLSLSGFMFLVPTTQPAPNCVMCFAPAFIYVRIDAEINQSTIAYQQYYFEIFKVHSLTGQLVRDDASNGHQI